MFIEMSGEVPSDEMLEQMEKQVKFIVVLRHQPRAVTQYYIINIIIC